eukprot:CAMPEP_0206041894 /NCGR_PEP_ID=MMETSP1466-20131121/6228_1 /ASSEMBLY_ACC=CAM_ASM_001126 /TAXON_ID=44452 /ORGANISM="Pavlova gyrans, Strain CCMP608" /LENGTH=528 /DNA_ID=CAMNT_0053416597 /DNA_START=15 /DNA_END=1598 /DNA_ORIENTATION=-
MDISAELKKRLDSSGCVEDTLVLASELSVPHTDVVGVVNSLFAKGYVTKGQMEATQVSVSAEGEAFIANGSAEAQVYNAVPEGAGIPQAELSAKLGAIAKAGMSKAMAAQFIRVEKTPEATLVHRNKPSIEDTVQAQLVAIKTSGVGAVSQADADVLKKRKLISTSVIKSFKVGKGESYAEWGSGKTPAADLTPEMIMQGTWKEHTFKPVNLNSMGKDTASGYLHPLMKVRTQFRSIFLEMGFQEMCTNRFVESSFWNFDALFQPQQHPARDMHDTFFVKTPARTPALPADYLAAVKQMHSAGGFGSTGWRYDWSEDESRKNLLRTHTTAVSSRTLYDIAQLAKKSEAEGGGFKPGKYFSIDRVFRNEALDATHLAEFHQVEGFIIDRNLTLGNLLGVLQEFFGRLGMTGLKFKPTYNPYTEPSLEVHAWHEGLQRIVEVGNSGVFRPEMLRPMGFDEDVSVIAWGLSLERPTMIRYKVNNIRDLFGHKVNVGMVKANPIAALATSRAGCCGGAAQQARAAQRRRHAG